MVNGADATGYRQYAFSRFWPGGGFNDVYAVEPIPRRDGSATGVLAKPKGIGRRLCTPVDRHGSTPKRDHPLRAANRSVSRKSSGAISVRYRLLQSCRRDGAE